MSEPKIVTIHVRPAPYWSARIKGRDVEGRGGTEAAAIADLNRILSQAPGT